MIIQRREVLYFLLPASSNLTPRRLLSLTWGRDAGKPKKARCRGNVLKVR